ncbi:MAG: hypothetical protein EOM91_13780 [Sphingobacteriia bacterium]|nr:hypothetical protein [Sphingobacteriia bacterium]NCC39565.1 hypothetical protein [Gammaproteobacteria bacterium]
MKYAAKRTWPEKPKAWEFKGEAQTAESFALDFASTQDLRLGTEILVIEREGDDAEIQFFKVVNTSPHQVVTVDPRAGTSPEEAPSVTQAPAPAEEMAQPVALPGLRPFTSMILYMAKIGLIATALIFAVGMLLKYLRA